MDRIQGTHRLRLPEQTLQRLTFCKAEPRKLREWVDSLPIVNVGETSRQVYQTIQEFNHLQIDTASRFAMAEILRPTVHYLCDALAKHYLNQPVVLPERAAKVATLAQALQNHMGISYKIIATQLIDRFRDSKGKDAEALKTAAISIHRAISEVTLTMLRCYQLYFSTPRHSWSELHTLFLLADQHRLTVTSVSDSQPPTESTIEAAYMRALLLATSKPNQLRQQEIQSIFDATALWSPLASVRSAGAGSDLFVFNLDSDAPPTYRTLAKESDASCFRYIEAAQLIKQLQEAVPGQPGTPRGINADLLRHLIQSWGTLTERSFSRTAASGQIRLCVGLSATHYYTAGRIEFDKLLRMAYDNIFHSDKENPFMGKGRPNARQAPSPERDPWSMAFDAGPRSMANDVDSRDVPISFTVIDHDTRPDDISKYDTYHCEIANISPGGYCIDWKGDVPSAVKTGEILGLQESGQTHWSLGIIRWIKHMPGKGAQLGIELLAPKASACGAQALKKTGESSEFMRALLLPELRAIGQPATLILPTLAFRAGYKIQVNISGQEYKAQLTRQVGGTAAFAQFEFVQIDAQGNVAQPGKQDATNTPPAPAAGDDFDSIWSSL